MSISRKLFNPTVVVTSLAVMLWFTPPGATGSNLAEGQNRAAVAVNNFGFELFGEMTRQGEAGANIVISPVSAATALTMTGLGSEGETRDAMARVLGIENMDFKRGGRDAGELLSSLESADEKVAFNSFQAVWVDKSFEPANNFAELNKQYFEAETAALDFGDPATPGRINARLSRETNELVNNILDEIQPDEIMYLVNAVYFKGDWANTFKADRTTAAPFVLSNGDSVTCSMMSSEMLLVPYCYGAKQGFQAVELPYGSGRFAMTIILPDKGRELSEISSTLNAESWREWTELMQKDIVTLKIPKFKLTCDFLLNDPLTSMGMGIAFDPEQADFSGMSENGARNLWLSRVIHKTVIEVNEEGTEAGAGSVAGISKGPQPQKITVDRPFLFGVRDTSTGAILFLARVADPTR